MLGSDDITQMKADLGTIRSDNEESIVIRREGTTLAAQNVRIVQGASAARERGSEASEASHGRVTVQGDVNLDIEVGDRFNDSGGQLYEVTLVQANRLVAVTAEANLIE